MFAKAIVYATARCLIGLDDEENKGGERKTIMDLIGNLLYNMVLVCCFVISLMLFCYFVNWWYKE